MEKEQKQRMTEKERMLNGKLYCPFKVGDNSWEKSREVLEKFNSMPWNKERGYLADEDCIL